MIQITATKQISWDCVQVTLSMGSSFFVRSCYLQELPAERLVPQETLSELELEDLADAGLAFSAEKAAMAYLGRAEQSRHLLAMKLRKKGHGEVAVARALDYLEGRNFLCDSRFAEAWLRNRSINHAEGRTKLLSGLLAKGVDRSTAIQSLDQYFEVVDQDDLLDRALEKCRRLGKTVEATEKYLLRKGFSYKEIKLKMSNL